MYLVSAPHPLKTEAQILTERLIAAGERLVKSAEVLQEILHRYTATQRREAIEPALRIAIEIVDEVFPVEHRDVMRAAEITQLPMHLPARDAVHIAVMERHGVRSILSFDADFDRWPGIKRIHSEVS